MSPFLRALYAALLLAVIGLALIPDTHEAGTWYAAPRLAFASVLVVLLVSLQVAFIYDLVSYLRRRGAALVSRRGGGDRY